MEKCNLISVEKNINKTLDLIKEEQNRHETRSNELNNKLSNLKHDKEILMNNLGLDKIKNAKRFVYTKGVKKNFYGDATKQLAEAIFDVSQNFKIMKKEYIGCKNYQGFDGQAVDCEYGMCPTYGSMILEIGLTSEFRNNKVVPDENDICDILYYLNLLTTQNGRDKVLKDYE
jgi:hypothetical protein